MIALLALGALVALIAQNGQHVRFEWLWLHFSASLAVMLLATVVVTLVFGAVGGLIWRHRRRAAMARRREVGHNTAGTRTATSASLPTGSGRSSSAHG